MPTSTYVIKINEAEAWYVCDALRSEMPLRLDDTLTVQTDDFSGMTLIEIGCSQPLMLDQRRFLVHVGFPITLRAYVE